MEERKAEIEGVYAEGRRGERKDEQIFHRNKPPASVPSSSSLFHDLLQRPTSLLQLRRISHYVPPQSGKRHVVTSIGNASADVEVPVNGRRDSD